MIFVVEKFSLILNSELRLIRFDDWRLAAHSTHHRADLLESFDDRDNASSTLISSHLPVHTWHAYLGEPTLAGAIVARMVHQRYRIKLKTLAEPILNNRSLRPDGRSWAIVNI